MILKPAVYGGLVLMLASCAAYRPAPLNPEATREAYNVRTLRDSAFVRYLAQAGVQVDSVWPPGALALAALYFRRDLEEGRAAARAAMAGERSAGVRPQPGVGADVERDINRGRSEPPWGVALRTSATLELGGRRGARIAKAKAQTRTAEARLRQSAWAAVLQTRLSAQDVRATRENLEDAELEASALQSVDTLFRARFAEGIVSQADVAQNQAETQAALLEVTRAEEAHREAVAELYRTIAVPPPGEESGELAIRPDPGNACVTLQGISRDSLQRIALGGRWELGVAGAEYQEAEADVRLEVAKQHPDISLGPGLFFDHGVSKWTVSFGLPALALNRNRPAIEQAEARRLQAAARFGRAQETILAELDAARNGCRAGRAQLAAADSLARAIETRMAAGAAAYQRGELTRTGLALIDLARLRAVRARHGAFQRAALDGATLEAALGLWVIDPPPHWPDPTQDPRSQEPEH